MSDIQTYIDNEIINLNQMNNDDPILNNPISNPPNQLLTKSKSSLLSFQINFNKFKELTGGTHASPRQTQLLPSIQSISTIKKIINKKTSINMMTINIRENTKENNRNNNSNCNKIDHDNNHKEESKNKTQFDPNKFFEIHNKNLHKIKNMTNKHSIWHGQAHQTKKDKNETSMERLNKIKRHFRIGFCSDSIEKKKISPTPPEINEMYYLYHIIPGNNSEVIRKCMRHRIRWKEGLTLQDSHLMWSPLSQSIPYNKLNENNPNLQVSNHFEYHQVLSNKLNLFYNLLNYCERKNLDIFSYIPMTIYIQYESINYHKQISNVQYLFTHIEDFLNKESKFKYKDYFNTSEYNKLRGSKSSLYIPYNHYDGKNMWLIKAVNLNRGQCIKISNTIEGIENNIKHFNQGVLRSFRGNSPDINDNDTKYSALPEIKIVNKKELSKERQSQSQDKTLPKINYSINNFHIDKSKYQSSNVILQKYIEKPLLYKGRKFDIRIWVLLTHKMEVYAFKEGHLKAASVNYDIESTNSYIHITNYSVQKYNDNFSKFEYGNEISFEDFQIELDKNEDKKISVKADLFPKICDIIKLTMNSVRDKLNPNGRKMCFEIFGYDFIFDIDYNPYLLEINTNPGLEISSPLIRCLIPRMIDDAFKLTIDELFKIECNNKANYEKYNSSFFVKGYSNEENLFLKICDLRKR